MIDLPDDELIENSDGSVDIPDESSSAESEEPTDHLENLAEILPDAILLDISLDLTEAIDRDRESRKKRDKQYEDGLRRTGLGDDAPGGADFEGASDVVHPVLAEACVDFAARAIKELFPPQGPVKTSIIGQTTPEQLDRAERKRTFMNWQLTTQMPEYRPELEQLLTQLPLGGSQFQKFWHDDRFERPVSEFVPIDDILLPYSATSFYTAQRVTHVQHITQFEYEKRVRSGLYRDIPNLADASGLMPEQTDSAKANDKIEGKEEDAYNEDGLRDIYEVYCWHEVEGDEPDPYIITIDAYTEKVLAIYRNWAEGDDKKEKLDWLVEWKFIPWRGAYAIGFPQLIGSLSAAATGSLRALLDSAHINNLPGLIKLKSNKTVGQNTNVEATGISEIEGPPGIDDIRKLLMAMPFNPPSPILFQLLGWLTDAAKGVVRTAESAIANAGDRTPVGTTQAMIEQGSTIYSAIHARLHESQKKAFQILARINGTWLEDETQVEELGKLIIRRSDFQGSLDVMPVSDPAIFSEAQRYAQNQSLIQMQNMDAQDPSIHWNKVAIRRRVLKQMRIDDVDEILPLPPKPLTSDPMSEAMAVMVGTPIQATPEQDHMAHMKGHLLYLSSPVVINNPLVPPPPLQMLLGHVQQHIMFFEQQTVTHIQQQLQLSYPQLSPDALVAMAIEQAAPTVLKALSPVLQRVSELQAELQKKTPPPQMPPEIAASIQIAQMDVDRKTKYDQAMVQLKQQEQQTNQQESQLQLQLEQQQSQFQQSLDAQRLQMEDSVHQLKSQMDLMMNKMDNEQKQVTELLKNRDDNATAIQVEQLKQSGQTPPELQQLMVQFQQLLAHLGVSTATGDLAND